MSFPYNDRRWVAAGDFLEARVQAGQRVLAPDLFWWRVPISIDRWVRSNLHAGNDYDWVVVAKHDVEQFPRAFLEHVASTMRPVFANDLFVVWSPDAAFAPVDPGSPPLLSYVVRVAKLGDHPSAENGYERDPILRDDERLMRYADLDDAGMRAAENNFFRATGYLYPTERDRGYFEDVRTHLRMALDRWHGRRVLDVACGQYSLQPPDATIAIRVDFAEECLQRTVAADRDQPSCRHAAMDAHALAFPDATFGGVAFVDAIEHVRDAAAVLRETARVLTPGGELLVTFANRHSLNQLLMRKLGYPEFVTNHHHIREFAPDEMLGLLDEAGFDVVQTAGVGFYPYWGVPGVDGAVRPLTDDDPDVVEYLREVGRRAGLEFAYVGVVLAQRRDQTSSGSSKRSV